MFESDDYDQILSQLDFPNLPRHNELTKLKQANTDVIENSQILNVKQKNGYKTSSSNTGRSPTVFTNNLNSQSKITINVNSQVNSSSLSVLHTKDYVQDRNVLHGEVKVSPKHSKRKIIDSHFDYNTKRKFPGPAGLLTGSLQESKDESVCQLELFSQDIDCSQNSLKRGLFDLPIWIKLKQDLVQWNLHEVDTIKGIKQQALAGNLRRRKAQTVTAFVETVDRSATDPLIVLRDTTGNIKGTLHRDAWSQFSSYLVAEQCALVLWKPTVLTTGSAFKKHYLNITLSNIYAIFSSAVLHDDSEINVPEGYAIDCENAFTIIRIKESPETLNINIIASNNDNGALNNEQNLIDDLDSIFSDDIF